MDGLPPTILIDEALPSTQMEELLLFTLTSPSLHFRRTGSFIPIILKKLFPQLKWTSSYKIILTSFYKIILTSSSLNLDGRTPTIHRDELFPIALPDELFPIALLDELFLTAIPGELFPTTLPDELSPSTHVDERYSTTYTDEPFPSARKDDLNSPPSIDDLSHKQDAQLRNQVNTCKSDDEGHRLNLTNSTYANHIV